MGTISRGEERILHQREALDEDHVGVLGEPAQARRIGRIEAGDRDAAASRTPGSPGIASVTRATPDSARPISRKRTAGPDMLVAMASWLTISSRDRGVNTRWRSSASISASWIGRYDAKLEMALEGAPEVRQHVALADAPRRLDPLPRLRGVAERVDHRADGRERLGRETEDQALTGGGRCRRAACRWAR